MKKRIGLILTWITVIGLTGCQSTTKHHDSKPQTERSSARSVHSKKTSQFNEENSTEQNTEPVDADSIETTKSATVIAESSSSTDSTSSSNSSTAVKINNATEAENYLKQQLGYGDNSDVVPGNDPAYNGTDQNRQYYTVSLVSMSDKLHGKTGSMGIYRVYEDGTIVHVAQ